MLVVASNAQPPTRPEPTDGMINGKPAVLLWPATLRADGHPGDYLPLAGCSVLLAPVDEPERKQLYSCGQWFVPPRDRYYEWMEQGEMISGAQGQLLYTGYGSAGLTGTMPMIPAGYIALRDGHGLRDNVVVRYIHLKRMWGAFTRSELGSTAHQPVRMPPGSVVGVVLDRMTRDAVALIRPVELAAGKTSRVITETPAKGLSGVFADLTAAHGRRNEPVALALKIGDRAYSPDAFIESGRRVHGIWYGVPTGNAKLVVTNDKVAYNGPDLQLRAGQVTTLRADLPLKPALGVSVNMHTEAKPPEMFVNVFRSGEKTPLRREKISPGEPLRIDALATAPYRVVLEVPPWRFPRNVDLTDGTDGQITWELAPLAIEGTVRVGKTPTHARVTFLNEGDDWIAAETDHLGVYSTLLWLPSHYIVRVHADGQNAPFTELIEVLDSGTFDFTLPGTRYVVRVTNALTGQPIADARVVLNNKWESERDGPRNVVQDVKTDERGEAMLPPLRSGIVELAASAEGFKSTEILTRSVEEDGHDTIAFALRPEEETHALQLLLPDGIPAAKAELLATPLDRDDVLWRGEADEHGTIQVPKLLANALVLVRHPNAASAARLWSDDVKTWQLAPPQPPLTLSVERSPGEAARAARLMLWLGNLRIRGIALAFLTWSNAAPDRDGLWIARNLPHEPIRILAWQKSDPIGIASGAFDALATPVPDPPPAQWTVRAID